VALTWKTPNSNGDRIDKYEVSYRGPSSGTFSCAGSPCRVTGLQNGDPYTFKVRAHNGVAANGGWSDWSTDVKGEADDFTGPVLNLRVKLQRDSQVTVAWDAPATCDCSDVQKYRISWPGGGVHDAGASAREFVAGGVRNGEPVTISVVPLNKKGIQENRGPVTTVSGMGAGKPDVPGAPSVTGTDRGGRTAKGVTVSWSPVAANGPGPVSYQVNRTGGSGPKVVCNWVTATSCAEDVSNDGTTYSYTVKAKNAEADSPREAAAGGSDLHISSPSGATSIEASAPPDGVTISSFQATGSDGQARVLFKVGASHGKTNRVECKVSGSACGPWTVATAGANGDQLITGLSNGNTSTIQLRSCNGGTADLCSGWVSASTITYGKIGAVTLTGSAPGNDVNWRIDIDPNGKAVNYELRRDNGSGPIIASGTTGRGAFTRAGTDANRSYDTLYTYALLVSDTAGSSRTHSPAWMNIRTGAAPNPDVTASKGTACNGSNCPGATIACVGTCWYVNSNAVRFIGTSSCGVYNVGGGQIAGSWTQGNGTKQTTIWIGPNTPFFISCGNGARSPNYTW
jgi:hypothetical protein